MTLDELEDLALAATPGPWEVNGQNLRSLHPALSRAGGSGNLMYCDGSGWEHDGDPAYIAAVSPDVVLALIGRVRELEAK